MIQARHNLILQHLQTYEEVSVQELVSLLSVSPETIRRDLNLLAEQNLLYRTHGGAVSNRSRDIGKSFQDRRPRQSEAKRAIAEKALSYFFENAVICLDASSSSWYFTQVIPDLPCTVITSSMHNIRSLAHKPCIKTIATGGIYSPKYDAFYGAHAGFMLSRFDVDLVICSCTGIVDGSIWESNELNAVIKRKMIAAGKKVLLFADETKIGRKDLIKLCDLSDIDTLFTNAALNDEMFDFCQQHHINIVR